MSQLHLVTTCLLLCFLVGCQVEPPPATFTVTIDKATTHIVGPDDGDGFVDYVEATNLRHGKGVSPENNWQVVLRRVFGPLDWDEASDVAFYHRLGIPRLDPDSREGYVIPVSPENGEASALEEKRQEQFWKVLEGPWRREDYPEFAAWLTKHSEFWERLEAGSHVTQNYLPLVMTQAAHDARVGEVRDAFSDLLKSDDSTERAAAGIMIAVTGRLRTDVAPLSRWHTVDIAQESRKVARIFRARSNLRISEGDLDGARTDLLTIHRVARLSSRGMLSEWLIGRALEWVACHGDAELLRTGNLSKEACEAHLADLNQLAPLPPAANQIDVECRYSGLDSLQSAGRTRREAFEASAQAGTDREILTAFATIDWNEAMRLFNRRCDALVAASSEPHPVVRQRLTAKSSPKSPGKNDVEVAQAIQSAVNASQDLTVFMADLCFSQHVFDLTKAELRSVAYLIVVRSAFAAELYRFEHSKYPDRVEKLQPILGEVPMDPFCGQPIRITTIDGDFVVYSVGENQADDGGLWMEDEWGKDDIRVRLPIERQ